ADTRDFPPNTQPLEAAQDEIKGIFKDREEVMGLNTPHYKPDLAQHRIQLNSRVVLLIGKQHAFSPMLIQGITMSANDKPAHNACRDKIEAIDHLQNCLPLQRTFRPVQ